MVGEVTKTSLCRLQGNGILTVIKTQEDGVALVFTNEGINPMSRL